MRFEETGANTGVFESQNGDDGSNISPNGNENDDFTIEYADSDVQVFIEDFDSTLEVIADGTWDSGESLTVRLTNENLNTQHTDGSGHGARRRQPSNTDAWGSHHASY